MQKSETHEIVINGIGLMITVRTQKNPDKVKSAKVEILVDNDEPEETNISVETIVR